jgi:hypothetical protein
MRRIPLVAVSLLALAAGSGAQAGEAPGELRCSVAGGIGFAVTAKRATSCVYYRRDGRVEFYIGSFGRFGLDIGPAQARQAIFSVTAPVDAPLGALEGAFVGAGVGATLGQGFAGDALVGGRGGAVTIVPIANSRLTGLNVEAGIGALDLRYAGSEGRRPRYRGQNPDDAD